MLKKASLSAAFALSLALTGAACGAGPAVIVRESSPFTDEHVRLFDGRVDFVGDPTVLERAWRDDWDRKMQERISASDFVVLARIATLRTATDPEQRQTVHLGAVVERRMQGRPPVELDLPAADGDGGFSTIRDNQRQILEHMFVVFGKWQQREDGQVIARWHMNPASEAVVEQVQFLIDGRTPPARR